MNEATNTYLNDEKLFRLNKINRIEDYFTTEIKERESVSKKLNNYIAAFDYLDKILIILSATSGRICIISFTSIIGAPAVIASANFSLIFSLTTGIIKKLLQTTINKKKKHNEIFAFARSKLNSTETLISQASIDSVIGHEKYQTIISEKEKYERMKENIRMMKIDELNEKYKNIRENNGDA